MATNRTKKTQDNFETLVKKSLGKKWHKVSKADKKMVRELSECQSILKPISYENPKDKYYL